VSEIKTEPKRLVDLNPEWLPTPEVVAKHGLQEHSAIEFDCPCGTPPVHVCNEHCKTPCPYAKYPGCAFGRVYLPITGRGGHSVTWDVTSATDDFETLTLSPSILATGPWHGHCVNGMLVSC
jgi:hypothetical protein